MGALHLVLSVWQATSGTLKQRRLDAMHCESVPAADFALVCEALEDALDAAEACKGVECNPTCDGLAAIITEIEESWVKAIDEVRKEAAEAEEEHTKEIAKHDEAVNEWSEKLADMAKDLDEMKRRAERAEEGNARLTVELSQLGEVVEHLRAEKPLKKRGAKST